MLATNPETFDILLQNNINLFHGTNIEALPNILKYGMNSFDELSKMGIDVLTGEEYSRERKGRSFISFTDDLDTAIGYAGVSPIYKDQKEDKSFGILIGISSDDLRKLGTCRVLSDIPEIGITSNIALENIKFIGVPESKVQFVRKLVGDKSITVASVDLDNKFYYIEDNFYIDDEKAEDFIKGKKQEESTIFRNEDVQEIARERKISGIKRAYLKIKEKIIGKGKDIENGSRE